MVNFGLNSASILGIFLAVAGAGLYFLRSVRPELSRDHDIFFAAVGLLCGLILLFQGWRLDPILQFGQFLLTGSVIFFAVETIRLRGATTEQARRNFPVVDDERRVSKTRVYTEAELDRLEPYEEEAKYANNRRLRGYEEPRSSRSSRRSTQSYSDREPTRQRRPRRPSSPSPQPYDAWSDSSDMWEERSTPRRPRPDTQAPETTPRSSRKHHLHAPSDQNYYPNSSSEEATLDDYVDYQPINQPQRKLGKEINPSSTDQESKSDHYDDDSNPTRFDY
ncbi:MAG: Ycf66 family protein [cyanobacterium endosymbiont of Rhopalodia musculus]|uniref:Ycf66 family protein n=1 Tax=cyanobacterium endosymbiont of Epithemia clementina EcSB TaxID=3034674 RepID=UPI0024806F65|nr:Ycf66 family protein [cyanobacterium endosymbiont of Epithemia clementina EcSB]WGT67867.1 Ycf66 family protein [cyanobacterium endosymbiont of Epithemia clementina EcSB]